LERARLRREGGRKRARGGRPLRNLELEPYGLLSAMRDIFYSVSQS
jgi:hypothetical protein